MMLESMGLFLGLGRWLQSPAGFCHGVIGFCLPQLDLCQPGWAHLPWCLQAPLAEYWLLSLALVTVSAQDWRKCLEETGRGKSLSHGKGQTRAAFLLWTKYQHPALLYLNTEVWGEVEGNKDTGDWCLCLLSFASPVIQVREGWPSLLV